MNKWLIEHMTDVPVESITLYEQEMMGMQIVVLLIGAIIIVFK